MPADNFDPAELHPEDAAAFDVLFDQFAHIARELTVAGLATAGLAAALDRHHDLERFAAVQRVAERLTTAGTLLSAGAQLLDLAQHLEQPVPLPDPIDRVEPVDPPVEDDHPLDVREGPGRGRPVPPADGPQLPTEHERQGGPFVTRSAAAEGPGRDAASVPARTLSDETVELPRLLDVRSIDQLRASLHRTDPGRC